MSLSRFTTPHEGCVPVPLVIVQGFLGTGVFSWDYHINKHGSDPLRRRRIILASLGPVSSLHDRACELFYSLVGGRVDYGPEHSATHAHARYGREFPDGLYPSWSKNRPLHFVGHSIGGPTIIKLQHLLQEGHFGKNYHPDMVLSLNAVCAPFRGTQSVYMLGESTTSAPAVRPFSIGAGLAKLVHVLAYLSPVLPSSLDVHADARSLSYRDLTLVEFLRHLWRSDWAESRDAAPYDMTFEAADHRATAFEGRVYPNTFYRSHVSVMTSKTDTNPNSYHHHPRNLISFTHNILYIMSKLIGTFDYTLLDPQPSFSGVRSPRSINTNVPPDEKLEQASQLELGGEEYWANDGIVPTFSQWHPLPCQATSCSHEEDYLCSDVISFQLPRRGSWSVHTTEDSNHLSLIPGPLSDDIYQKRFWTELGAWLDAVDSIK